MYYKCMLKTIVSVVYIVFWLQLQSLYFIYMCICVCMYYMCVYIECIYSIYTISPYKNYSIYHSYSILVRVIELGGDGIPYWVSWILNRTHKQNQKNSTHHGDSLSLIFGYAWGL